jgi:hypothetical protein
MHHITSYLSKTITYSAHAFVVWRMIFGLYFVFYALRMLPYIKEIYGSDGIVPVVTANWTYGIFPNILAIYSGYEAALVLHMILIVAGLALAGGFLPRVAALSIWYIQTALYNRNVLTDDPSMAFVGLLLLMLALIPSQPKFGKRLEQIQIPYFVFYVPLFVFCLTFTVSGIDKLLSPSWFAGVAFGDMLTLAISRGGVLSAAILSHHFFISFFTYVALSIQILSMCFFLFGMYRIALYSNLASFCLVFVLFDLNQVVIGMLFFFTFFSLRDIPYIHAFYKKLRA